VLLPALLPPAVPPLTPLLSLEPPDPVLADVDLPPVPSIPA